MPTVLESLLDPISRAEFREHYYGRQPLLIRGHPRKLADLYGWDDLNRLLNGLRYPHPYVHAVAADRADEAATAENLVERCRAGASIRFSQIQLFDPKVGELARALEAEMGEPMMVTLFLSQPSQAAVARHYDLQDVFVLHVDGHKGWQVYDRTVEKPSLDMVDFRNPPAEVRLECELAPGDVLYIPRGHWHQALAQRGTSLHLTVAVAARTGIDFMNWLLEQLRNDVRFRDELPLSFAGEPDQLREERLRERAAGFGQIVRSRLADAETLRSFDEYCVMADRDVRRFKFPAPLLDAPSTQLDVRHFTRPARQRFLLEDGPTDDRIVLSVWGYGFHFPRNAKPLVEFILSRTEFVYEDALAHAGELTEQGVREKLDPLLREGIVDANG